jgi:hypothetical protein
MTPENSDDLKKGGVLMIQTPYWVRYVFFERYGYGGHPRRQTVTA